MADPPSHRGARRRRDPATRCQRPPRFDGEHQTVTGVVLSAPGTNEFVPADLVVDASGRGTRLPAWLDEWGGFARPHEQTVDVGIGYSTQQLRIPDGLIAEKVVVAGASRTQQAGLGMLFYEDGTWGLTTFTVNHVAPPQTLDEIYEVADAVLPEPLAAAIRQGEPVGDIAFFHRYPVSRWRRYDKLQRFPPGGIVPIGDAVASFNPTYGQGMTMTALQAGHLRRLLAAGTRHLAYDLARATAKSTYPVWTMNAIGDLTLHGTEGPAPGGIDRSAPCSTSSSVPPRMTASWRNGSCAGSACWTACTWFRPPRSWAARFDTTCRCGGRRNELARQCPVQIRF